MPMPAKLPSMGSIRPISDLRTHLPEIEEEAKAASVVLNRNGKPALIVTDYELYQQQEQLEREARLLREAEIWDRASGSKSYSLNQVKHFLAQDHALLDEMGLSKKDA